MSKTVLLRDFENISRSVLFDTTNKTYTRFQEGKKYQDGFYTIKDEKMFAYYSNDGKSIFYDGKRLIEINGEMVSMFVNIGDTETSSFSLYEAHNLVFHISYPAWWSGMQGFRPNTFIPDVRDEDIEFDFFAFLDSKLR